ncbi:hypothetical protein NPIL_527461 [Nephila pilipes]|uniref:Uncharacterized protein n=1 Tax=Nephila pilipes TaxID=299642 RepID=A0A8X6MFS0_NEPPI|nr:hypothetical protein NPIL_527461 [Nephila pilipes]
MVPKWFLVGVKTKFWHWGKTVWDSSRAAWWALQLHSRRICAVKYARNSRPQTHSRTTQDPLPGGRQNLQFGPTGTLRWPQNASAKLFALPEAAPSVPGVRIKFQ